MNASSPLLRGLWSIGAVLAGILAGGLLSIGTDNGLHAAGIVPSTGETWPDKLLLLPAVYRTVYSIIGCWLTARLAPSRGMVHALVLGALGVVVNIIGLFVVMSKDPAFAQQWYPIALAALSMPAAWVGGKLGGKFAADKGA